MRAVFSSGCWLIESLSTNDLDSTPARFSTEATGRAGVGCPGWDVLGRGASAWLHSRCPRRLRPSHRAQMSTTAAATTSSQASSNNNSTTTHVSIPQSAPAGLLTITQPPESTIAFFKIAPSQTITFAWNFSYLLSTPASLTVSAICENGYTYPVGPTNGIIPGDATSVLWDAYAWQTNNPNSPLAQATYTLEIFDNRGPGSARSPGLLQPNNALRFALYTPQPYTPLGSGQLLFFFDSSNNVH